MPSETAISRISPQGDQQNVLAWLGKYVQFRDLQGVQILRIPRMSHFGLPEAL